MEFYNKIDKLCASHNVSRRKMCEEIGLSYNTFNSMLKRQSKNITLDVIEAIANYFQVTIDYLIRDNINDPNYALTEKTIENFSLDNIEDGSLVLFTEGREEPQFLSKEEGQAFYRKLFNLSPEDRGEVHKFIDYLGWKKEQKK